MCFSAAAPATAALCCNKVHLLVIRLFALRHPIWVGKKMKNLFQIFVSVSLSLSAEYRLHKKISIRVRVDFNKFYGNWTFFSISIAPESFKKKNRQYISFLKNPTTVHIIGRYKSILVVLLLFCLVLFSFIFVFLCKRQWKNNTNNYTKCCLFCVTNTLFLSVLICSTCCSKRCKSTKSTQKQDQQYVNMGRGLLKKNCSLWICHIKAIWLVNIRASKQTKNIYNS